MRRVLNYLLAISFVLTIMVPNTGVIVHKLASTLFLVLALIHVFYRKKSKNRIIRINTGILSNMKQKIKEFYH